MGFERSRLGYPTSDEIDMAGGRMSNFEHGQIRWTPAGGPKATIGGGLIDDNVGVPADG